MKTEVLLDLLLQIEQEDPIDYTGLPMDADDLRQLACLNVVDILEKIAGDFTAQETYLLMAATTTRLVLENMVLQARLAILVNAD